MPVIGNTVRVTARKATNNREGYFSVGLSWITRPKSNGAYKVAAPSIRRYFSN
jgi:hypothetical protein